jgi:hypothetical protein
VRYSQVIGGESFHHHPPKMNTIKEIEVCIERQRTALAGMASAEARMGQTLKRAKRLSGDALAILQEAEG